MKYFYFHLFFFLIITSLSAQNLLIWDGEGLADSACTYDWGVRTNVAANVQQGNYAFQGNPDNWHSPGIRLNCRNTWRANLRDYDEIWFYAKSSSTTVKPLRLSIYGWPYSSKGVDVTPYIVGGGGITNTYKLVKIPLDSLKTANYTLGSIEILYFGTPTPPTGYKTYIDNIWAMDLRPTWIKDYKILSNNSFRLQIQHRYDTTDVKQLSHYQLTSPTDTDFSTPQNAVEVGLHYYVEDYDPADNYNNPIPICNFYLYPIFDKKMKNVSKAIT